jgi:hypothetical protein
MPDGKAGKVRRRPERERWKKMWTEVKHPNTGEENHQRLQDQLFFL